MQFSSQDIDRQFDPGTFARGQAYLRQGRVLRLDRVGERIEGRVRGSGNSIYTQSVRVVAGRGGPRFEGDCSCPMSYNCKHVVALLLESVDLPGTAAPASGLSLRTEQWLHAAGQLRDAAPAAVKPGPAYRLVYVLVPDPDDDLLHLHVGRARVLGHGAIGATRIETDLDMLLAQRPAYLRPEDQEPLRLIAALRAGAVFGRALLPAGPLGARLLALLCRQGRLWIAYTLGQLQQGRLALLEPGPRRAAALDWVVDPDTHWMDDDEDEHADTADELVAPLVLRWRFDDGGADADAGGDRADGAGDLVDYVIGTEPPCYVCDMALGELALADAMRAVPVEQLMRLVATAPPLPAGERAGVAARLAEAGLAAIVPPPQAVQRVERDDIVPTPRLVLGGLPVRGRGAVDWHDYALLSFDYDGMAVNVFDGTHLQRAVGGVIETIARDDAAEGAAAAMLTTLGFAPAAVTTAPPMPADAWQLAAQQDWLAFSRAGLPDLVAAGWQVEFEDGYRYALAEVDDWYAELDEEGEGGDWFALELGVIVAGDRYPLLPFLVQMIRAAPQDFQPAALAARDDAGELLVDLPGAIRVALPWGRIKPILGTLGELYFGERGDALRLPLLDAARLAELERAAKLRWLGGERLRALGRKLAQFDGVREVAPPAGLQAQLRPYQRSGLAWMQFLREYDCAGILADDMGLGKTIQTLAHVLAEKEAGRLDAPALVVAPTSLMGNWQAEAARFAPGLRVLLLHGKDRAERFERIGEADLVLTTYPLLGRDEAALRRQHFHLLILDEAQYIKNSRAKAAQVVCLLDARHRLCLTGTPVQNHLGELWSQFHFLMPGLLGEEKAFNTQFRKPIEQGGDLQRRDLLVRRLKPFMLRRTKDKVATELPPKTEIMLPVDMNNAQRDLYETVRVAMNKKVRDEIDRKGLARSQIVILDALLKLRQVCCDPRLLRPATDARSAKLDALLDLLDTLRSEGRKVLVFSQFTSMLALIEHELNERGVAYALLTGDTVERDAQVRAFQDGAVDVFLISLKAGGVGLNLTAADTVIHYDPWWNPASEHQATDRAWRIGQTQPVFVYKLIARGTLEEKIQEMQQRKGDLANAVLAPEGGLSAAIGADDLHALFG